MHHKMHRFHNTFFKWRTLFSEELVALLLVLFIIAAPAGATTRFENRSLFMQSVTPGATTSYELSLNYMTLEPVGSLELLFCVSPVPQDPCVIPPGFSATGAVLSEQSGEVGFSLSQTSQNRLVLSRPSVMIAGSGLKSTYKFDNITNPTNLSSFSIRIKSHSSSDASGPQIDFGSVKGQTGDGITLMTQVPPMLIFCAAQEVQDNCSGTNETYFSDMGTLSVDDTLTAQSQFAVGTNASGGFAVTVSGAPLSAGTNIIDGVASPTASLIGSNQFGINLVENDELGVGQAPEGTWANALPAPDYEQPNKFKYVDGDVIAFSPNVSLMKKFTVSYVVNVSPNLKAGVYTTTINYIASGRF